MHVKDLRREPPRRWSDEADGIAWLPRLIDKARAALAGTLGSYLFGQSPMDIEFLNVIRLSHRDFARIVANAPDDRGIVDALAQRDPAAIERARAWSARLPHRHGTFLCLLDVDDGYARGGAHPLKPLLNRLTFMITWGMKRLFPSRAIEGLERSW